MRPSLPNSVNSKIWNPRKVAPNKAVQIIQILKFLTFPRLMLEYAITIIRLLISRTKVLTEVVGISSISAGVGVPGLLWPK